MDKDTIKKLENCRKIIGEHRETKKAVLTDEKHTELTNSTMKLLKEEGFDSLQDYSKWDAEQCFQAYCECRPLQGSCDKCVGLGSTPPCQLKYGSVSCFFTAPDKDAILKLCFTYYLKKDTAVKNSNKRVALCPEGHGYYVDLDKSTALPFDITYKVFT